MAVKKIEDVARRIEDQAYYQVEVFKVRHEHATTFLPGRKYLVKGKVVTTLGEDVRVLGEKAEKAGA